MRTCRVGGGDIGAGGINGGISSASGGMLPGGLDGDGSNGGIVGGKGGAMGGLGGAHGGVGGCAGVVPSMGSSTMADGART